MKMLLGECREASSSAIGKAFIGYAELVIEHLKEELVDPSNGEQVDLTIKGAIAGLRRYIAAVAMRPLTDEQRQQAHVIDGAYNP
jgi:hypothetical protein